MLLGAYTIAGGRLLDSDDKAQSSSGKAGGGSGGGTGGGSGADLGLGLGTERSGSSKLGRFIRHCILERPDAFRNVEGFLHPKWHSVPNSQGVAMVYITRSQC